MLTMGFSWNRWQKMFWNTVQDWVYQIERKPTHKIMYGVARKKKLSSYTT